VRKFILFNLVTLDGFFAGPNGEIDWHRVDEEFNEFAIDQLNNTDGLIFGRVTYQMMAGYWSTPAAVEDDPVVASKMNSIPKFVASRSLDKVDWKNSRLIKGDIPEEFLKIKQQAGRDLFIFGSADLAETLIQHNLVDEYRLIVIPILLGKGKPMFKGVRQSMKLKLVRTRLFQNGNILLVYVPEVVGK
jgi:dihydrofolate reductase